MGKSLFIAEKPSVAQEFARVLKVNSSRKDGYLESDDTIVTWCVGHLVTMSYPEAYDIKYKKWNMDTLPFLPETFKYEIISSVAKQFNTVRNLLNREDVETIYVCTDSGREGEYIYRLVEQMAQVKGKNRKRVWIDSQTEEEILRGVREARDLSEYDALAASAYLRAKEDYLMGINFSRVLTLKYGNTISSYLGSRYFVISVGRVMTCVLGMVVRREREIRSFVKTPFYRILQKVETDGSVLEAEWKVDQESAYYAFPRLYKDNGFSDRNDAEALIGKLKEHSPLTCIVNTIEKKQEKKNPPLLFNLAEIQNECSKRFKISPDQTLQIIQELYEKKLVTYPRTDARVLSTAVAKIIQNNIKGLLKLDSVAEYADHILQNGLYKGLEKTRYVNDKQITDHYAIIPTGQGLPALHSMSDLGRKIYDVIVRRFLSIFYPPAVYQKITLTDQMESDRSNDLQHKEKFICVYKILVKEGYLEVSGRKKNTATDGNQEDNSHYGNEEILQSLQKLRKGSVLSVHDLEIKEGETTPPKRYNSGSMILAMENAGQLIEDEELRAQIRSCGIGTSATRAEILKKLVSISYLDLNKKTQIITPTQSGEMVYDVVDQSIRPLLNAELTASWEKGLNYVAEGSITSEEYMTKLEDFVSRRVEAVRNLNNQRILRDMYEQTSHFYSKSNRINVRKKH